MYDIAIDIGNTNTVFAIMKNDEILEQFRMRTDANRTADEYFVWFSTLLKARGFDALLSKVEAVILSTTVPQAIFNIRVLSHRYFSGEPYIVGSEDFPINIASHVDKGVKVGPDRLVNVHAGFCEYGGNLIIVDFGTATTFDICNHEGAYDGGIIATGVNLSLKALSDAAAALPYVEVNRPKTVIGRNTKDAMQSGIYWGYIAMVEGLCDRIETEYEKPMKRIITGGLASLYAQGLQKEFHLDRDITIKGLNILLKDIKQKL